MSNNLYVKIEELEKNKPLLGESLSKDQKTIINSTLEMLEKEIAEKRAYLSKKAKIKPENENIKKSIDEISYSTINIRHIKIKLGIKLSSDQ